MPALAELRPLDETIQIVDQRLDALPGSSVRLLDPAAVGDVGPIGNAQPRHPRHPVLPNQVEVAALRHDAKVVARTVGFSNDIAAIEQLICNRGEHLRAAHARRPGLEEQSQRVGWSKILPPPPALQEVTGPGRRTCAVRQSHHASNGLARVGELLLAPAVAKPGDPVPPCAHPPKLVRDHRKGRIAHFARAKAQLTPALAESNADPTQISGEEIGELRRRKACSEMRLQPGRHPQQATPMIDQPEHVRISTPCPRATGAHRGLRGTYKPSPPLPRMTCCRPRGMTLTKRRNIRMPVPSTAALTSMALNQ